MKYGLYNTCVWYYKSRRIKNLTQVPIIIGIALLNEDVKFLRQRWVRGFAKVFINNGIRITLLNYRNSLTVSKPIPRDAFNKMNESLMEVDLRYWISASFDLKKCNLGEYIFEEKELKFSPIK